MKKRKVTRKHRPILADPNIESTVRGLEALGWKIAPPRTKQNVELLPQYARVYG